MILYRSDQSSIIIYMDQRDAPPAPGNMNTTYNMPTAGFHRLFVGTGRLYGVFCGGEMYQCTYMNNLWR